MTDSADVRNFALFLLERALMTECQHREYERIEFERQRSLWVRAEARYECVIPELQQAIRKLNAEVA